MSSETMTGPELYAALKQLGISRAEFARLLGSNWQTVQRWCGEGREQDRLPVPEYVAAIVRLLREQRRLELQIAELEYRLERARKARRPGAASLP